MAVRVTGELAPCERVGEWGSDTSHAGADPTRQAGGLPRVGGAGAAANAMLAVSVRAQRRQKSLDSAWGEPMGVWELQKHQCASHTGVEGLSGHAPGETP